MYQNQAAYHHKQLSLNRMEIIIQKFKEQCRIKNDYFYISIYIIKLLIP